MDYFGLFYIREVRKEIKRYGVLFICRVLYVIYFKIVVLLIIDLFLNVYRRFVCRRGFI